MSGKSGSAHKKCRRRFSDMSTEQDVSTEQDEGAFSSRTCVSTFASHAGRVALPHVEVDLAPAAAQLLLKPRHQWEHRVLLHQPVRRELCRMAAAV